MAIGWRCDGARHVQTLLALGPIGDLADGQLLERFATRDGERSELAFAALVERHGPMVLRTCRAILRDGHDAHDAFQATFLVLARRAGSLRVGESLAGWLHQVARRTALCARSASARRRKHEGRAAGLTALVVEALPQDDLGEILHAEIARLPDRHRAAVVLCLLEGLTHDQAANRLGWPVGTLQSRLARGRERLRSRLTRRGLAPTIAPAGIAMPVSLIDATARAATGFAAGRMSAEVVSASVLSLFQEVRSAMFFSKLKLAGAAALGVGLGVSGVGVLAQQDEAKPADFAAEVKKVFPANRSIGERVTILVEKPDASGKLVAKHRVTSQLDGTGQIRILDEILEGEHAGSTTLTCKVARIEFRANSLAGPEEEPFEVEILTLSPGPVSVSTRTTREMERAKTPGGRIPMPRTSRTPGIAPSGIVEDVNISGHPGPAPDSLLAPAPTDPASPTDPNAPRHRPPAP